MSFYFDKNDCRRKPQDCCLDKICKIIRDCFCHKKPTPPKCFDTFFHCKTICKPISPCRCKKHCCGFFDNRDKCIY
ncbi:MAG: hypothetical protein PHE12_00165 [Clostridia bacterium]|nr:hypothetical protein [Clostridia bacterium]